MNQNEAIKKVLRTYDLEKPIPPEIRWQITPARKETLINILKKNKKYSIFVLFVINFFFWARKLGIPITIAKSAAIIGITSLVLVGGMTVSTYIAVKYFIFEDVHVPEKKNLPELPKEDKDEKKQINNKKSNVHEVSNISKKETDRSMPPKFKIGISTFQHGDKEKSLARDVTSKIYTGLLNLRNKKDIFMINEKSKKFAEKLIVGSVLKYGDNYRITAKVIERTSSKVLYYISEKIETENDIDSVCEKISKGIADKIRNE